MWRTQIHISVNYLKNVNLWNLAGLQQSTNLSSIFWTKSISCLVCKISESGEKCCDPKPKIISNVSFRPQPKDFSLLSWKEGKKPENIHKHIQMLESENFNFRFYKITQTD